ncbi:aminotransferase class I/II-fold pyridoxal phosphate-dependent enzyme [Rhodocaloribacter litoris]|uniref:trans-sulfuration enzyme family protein n=1 Tax=Rhodocaloribacter litoris TaxID=2558931 RepID=UPI001422C14F|nr:aminotransferase class I/II-fold pyridoxal phosphate-dependent enzyme [Rhodocaloribacter litoris]QXD14489.1 aminotransferase class I/II-fold pyridoxal phosphate-dependent enzyme [Rhodocaloribacter litoris]
MPSIDTKLIHAGEPKPRIRGAVAMPIFQTAMYEYGGEGAPDELMYVRYNNTPNHAALAHKLAALEETEAALVTGSGMAAISAALLAVLRPGDHLLAQHGLYGGTFGLVTRELPALGIEVSFVDAAAPDTWAAALRPNTRAFYVEAISNPLMEVGALDAVAGFAGAHGLVSLIDNTFTTPVNFRPATLGFDLVLHSATKYLNGHSDLVAGVVAGRADLVERAGAKLRHLGGALDPHACFLLHRGLKTLALRMQRHNESALRLARFLEAHPLIERVHYPGLASSPHHERASRLFAGFGGMISFEPAGGLAAADRLLQHLRLPVVAPSLGGVETLVTRPAITSHAGLTPEERARLGIHDHLIRLSVGIEGPDDLLADFEQALAALEVEAAG